MAERKGTTVTVIKDVVAMMSETHLKCPKNSWAEAAAYASHARKKLDAKVWKGSNSQDYEMPWVWRLRLGRNQAKTTAQRLYTMLTRMNLLL